MTRSTTVARTRLSTALCATEGSHAARKTDTAQIAAPSFPSIPFYRVRRRSVATGCTGVTQAATTYDLVLDDGTLAHSLNDTILLRSA